MSISAAAAHEPMCPFHRRGSTLARFKDLQDRVLCPFARQSRVWAGPDWSPELSLEANLARALPSLLEFTQVAREQELDAFVIELPDEAYGHTVEALARTTRRVLEQLAQQDPWPSPAPQADVLDPSWQFTFNRERLFVITFAPVYAPSSSRYGFGSRSVFLLLQPEHSFERLMGSKENMRRIQKRIRERFARHGQPYDLSIVQGALEAPRYVKPLKLGDPIVPWWKA